MVVLTETLCAGLNRCGKSCRLRWLNYLRPGIKRGNISDDEEELIVRLHRLLGNRWSLIAGRLPGRTDNEIKNYWNTTLSKRNLQSHGAGCSNHPQAKPPAARRTPCPRARAAARYGPRRCGAPPRCWRQQRGFTSRAVRRRSTSRRRISWVTACPSARSTSIWRASSWAS
ncbi:hypothetical protein VPH35_055562 [Triticum aestivum]